MEIAANTGTMGAGVGYAKPPKRTTPLACVRGGKNVNTQVMFSQASDDWSTPCRVYADLHDEFDFDCDCAASQYNARSDHWFGPDHPDPSRRDALTQPWAPMTCWLNPPYSRCRDFIAKAQLESMQGATVVCLVPSRTDTAWWHQYVWDTDTHRPQPHVEVRFIKGRLRSGNATSGAPFPSVLVIFRGHTR